MPELRADDTIPTLGEMAGNASTNPRSLLFRKFCQKNHKQ